MIGPRFPVDHGGILANPHPLRATLLLGPYRGLGFLNFGIFWSRRYRGGYGSENRLSIAAIRARNEGAVNSRRLVCDCRAILGKSRPARHRPGRPSFWSLIADKNASILAHFSRSDIGLEMTPEIGYPHPRLGLRKRAPLIPNAWSAIYGQPMGKSRPSHHQSGRPSSWALIAAKDGIFPRSLPSRCRRSENAPKLRHP